MVKKMMETRWGFGLAIVAVLASACADGGSAARAPVTSTPRVESVETSAPPQPAQPATVGQVREGQMIDLIGTHWRVERYTRGEGAPAELTGWQFTPDQGPIRFTIESDGEVSSLDGTCSWRSYTDERDGRRDWGAALKACEVGSNVGASFAGINSVLADPTGYRYDDTALVVEGSYGTVTAVRT